MRELYRFDRTRYCMCRGQPSGRDLVLAAPNEDSFSILAAGGRVKSVTWGDRRSPTRLGAGTCRSAWRFATETVASLVGWASRCATSAPPRAGAADSTRATNRRRPLRRGPSSPPALWVRSHFWNATGEGNPPQFPDWSSVCLQHGWQFLATAGRDNRMFGIGVPKLLTLEHPTSADARFAPDSRWLLRRPRQQQAVQECGP